MLCRPFRCLAVLIAVVAASASGSVAAQAAWPTDPNVNLPICRAPGKQQKPVTASDGSGGAIIAWIDERYVAPGVYAQRVSASGELLWAIDGVPLSTVVGIRENATITADGSGGAIVAWEDVRGGLPGIYAQRVDASGNVLWVEGGATLATYSHGLLNPSLAADGTGGAFVSWSQGTFTGYLYAQRISAQGVPTWTAGGIPVGGKGRGVQMVTDGSAGVILTWQVNTANYSGEVRAQRLDATGNSLWNQFGVDVGSGPGEQDSPVIVADGHSGAVIAWNDRRSGNGDIYIQHLDAAGNATWPLNGVPLSAAAGDQVYPGIVSDGAGGVIVAWHDYRFLPDRYLYAGRVDSGGNTLWPTNGVPLTDTPTNAHTFGLPTAIAQDGAGGSIVAWSRSGGGSHVRAQRTDAVGSVVWDPAGTAVSTGEYPRNDVVVCPAGTGGAIIAWTDYRNVVAMGEDIYAQRVSASGVLGLDNAPLVTAPPSTSGFEGVPLAFTVGASDPDGDAITSFTAAPLPTGATFTPSGDNTSGAFAWTPSFAQAGSYSVTFTAANLSTGTTATAITIENTDLPPVVTAPPVATCAEGTPLTVEVTVSDSDGDAIASLTAAGTAITAGARFSAGAGNASGTFSWTPDFTQAGSYGVTFTATSTLSASATTEITVANVVQYGHVSGRISAQCPAANTPLLGVLVDAYVVGAGTLAASAATDESGNYVLGPLEEGTYDVTVVAPLGYVASSQEHQVTITSTAGVSVDFLLSCLQITANPRSMGYWKHQVGVGTGGKGTAQISATTLCSYLDLIEQHFNSSTVNEVAVYIPPASGLCADKLLAAKPLLNLHGSAAMVDRARQQLTALLLNAAAGFIGLTQPISADGATVSQAITHCDNVIDDAAGDYEKAKTIADYINNGIPVPAGAIPLSTAQIAYRRGMEAVSFRVTPNPGRATREFRFVTAARGPVSLALYDVSGRLVSQIYRGDMDAGAHSVRWGGKTSSGATVARGLYFARLQTPRESPTIKVLQLTRE